MNVFKVKKIKKDSLGEKLECARHNKKLELLDVYRMSGIPVKYLLSLEREEWNILPGEIYLKNFLKKYCECLGLNYRLCLRQYNKQKLILPRKKIEERKGRVFFKKISDFITPRRFTIILFSIVVFVFIISATFEVINYIKPPKIEITYPNKEYTTIEDSVIIRGQTEPESILFINDVAVGVSEAGDFAVDVKLKPGLNKFEFISQKKHSRKNYEQLVIYQKSNL